jgi:hypothetical protein
LLGTTWRKTRPEEFEELLGTTWRKTRPEEFEELLGTTWRNATGGIRRIARYHLAHGKTGGFWTITRYD